MNGYYSFDQYPEEYDKICAMLSERSNHTGKYSKYNYDFNYGEIEKVAYLSWYDEHNHLSYRPALIFLFDEDIVTHIILYDWTYEVV